MSSYNIDTQTNKIENSEYFRSSTSFNSDLNMHLDSEFDHHLANMKKYILELKDKRGNFVFGNNQNLKNAFNYLIILQKYYYFF
jgi:hypothetical protein